MKSKCSHCNKEYELDSELLGKKAKCSDCQEVFLVTKFNELDDLFDDADNEEDNKGDNVDNEGEVETQVFEKEEDIHIKPHFMSFLFLGGGHFGKFTGILLLITLIFLFGLSGFVGVLGTMFPDGGAKDIDVLQGTSTFLYIFFGGLYILGLIWRFIQYKKESYVITDRKVIYNYGNLFSENSVDLDLNKVTQVSNILGFVQHTLFRTGNVIVKTAGSSNSTVNMQNISLSEDHYITLKERMKKNGFRLEMDSLVQEEKPHWLAIIGELFGKGISGILVLAYVAFSFYIEMQHGLEEGEFDLEEIKKEIPEGLPEISSSVITGGLSIGGIILIIFILSVLFKFLDLKRRRYRVFTDTVSYTEGFLTKNFSFIPIENVADTENTQNFWSKIFGLHDVEVSSQGENNKVVFKNMVNGEKLMANIKYLKNAIVKKPTTIIRGEEENKKDSLVAFTDQTEKALDFDSDFRAEYRMNWLRSLGPYLVCIVIPPMWPVLIIVGGFKLVEIFATTFIIGESSIEKKYQFINTKHSNFSVEKITGVIFKESLIDKMFNTCSIRFLSIGTGTNIVFKDINKTPELKENILSKVGIHLDEVQRDIVSEFNFGDYVKSQIGTFIFLTLFLIMVWGVIAWALSLDEVVKGLGEAGLGDYGSLFGVILSVLILFFPLLRFFYSKFYYSPVRYINRIYSEAIESVQGFFVQTKKYSLIRHIKSIKTVKYPLTDTGDFVFDVSGETTIQVQKRGMNSRLGLLSLLAKNTKSVTSSNGFSIKFLKNVFQVFDDLDIIVNEQPLHTEIVTESKQDLGNSLIFSIMLFLIIFFLILLVRLYGDLPQNQLPVLSFITIIFFVMFIIIVGLQIWYIRVKRYEYQKGRVVYYSGIIYKEKHSILYSNFNYIEKGRTFLNMLFRNGNIKIYTLGSSGIDMDIKDVDNFREVYEMLKKD